ncbi:ADP-ribosyltransferase [Nocardia cyriacigeorgica]|uniref:ADP ribosyltransferase domain-containing protein n=1 Tax=Nocardia cyriacigeorgica TaxID=135487 RepID=A0A6P1DDB1_9NOCA|nr:ADP-ribosyltransferase [Nocardia cyriacigeorgica]NEW42506.1 hypothetical protein [Nocardia cyriacigeorgica]NEW48198.1 hypothetical protein [Nocardia cyriacigeorgica]
MTGTVIDVDTDVYTTAGTELSAAAGAFWKAIDGKYEALSQCGSMTGTYDEAVKWATSYDQRTEETLRTSALLAQAANGYALLLVEMGYNHLLADHESTMGNSAPLPPKPTLPLTAVTECRIPLPSAGGPGEGLIDGGIELVQQVGVPIPDGDTGKLENARDAWNGMAADAAVAGFAAELDRIAGLFQTVTTVEGVFIDEDLRKLSAAAGECVGMMGDLGRSCGDHRDGLADMRTKMADELRQLAIDIAEDIAMDAAITIGLSLVTFGTGGAAFVVGRIAQKVAKYAPKIKHLVDAFKTAKNLDKGIGTLHDVAKHKNPLETIKSLEPKRAPTTPNKSKPDLTDNDEMAINSYSGMGFKDLNEVLRNPHVDPTPAQQQRIDALNNALDKLPNHEGKVVRHTNLPPEVLEKYQPGHTVTEGAFTSTSRNPKGATELWPQASDVEMQIVSKTGKDVQPWSKSPEEQEILFKSGTEFNVLDRWVDPVTGRTVIRMVER